MTVLHLRIPLVFRQRQYRLYFSGNLVSWIGNSMQFIANSWLALTLGGSLTAVAVLLMTAALPGVLLSPFVGVYIDRFDRRWLALGADAVRGVILCGTLLLMMLGLLQIWHLYLLSGLLSLGEVIYNPTSAALLREEIPESLLLYTNTYNSIARQAGSIVGAGLGGLLVAFSSPATVLATNAFSFFISAFCLLLLRKGHHAPAISRHEYKKFKHLLQDLQEGWYYIKHHSDITRAYSIMLILNATLDIINVMITIFVKDVLHASAAGLGAMETSFALGSISGNILLPALALRTGTNRTMTLGVWAMAITLGLLAISPHLWMALVSYFLLGITVPTWSFYFTRVQRSVPDIYQGRVHTTFNTFSSAMSLTIFLGIGASNGLVTPRGIYGIQALLLAAAGMIAYISYYGSDETKHSHAPRQKHIRKLSG